MTATTNLKKQTTSLQQPVGYLITDGLVDLSIMQRLFFAFLLCLTVVACFMSNAATRVTMRSSSLSMTR